MNNMKKSVLYILVIIFVFSSCSSNDEIIVSSNESIDYSGSDILSNIFSEWGITIHYQDVYKSQTYRLLQNLIDYLDKNQISTITFPSNDMNYPSVTMFNEFINCSKEATALFQSDDCVSVLISTYLNDIMTEREKPADNLRFSFLELILSSDMCMSKMNTQDNYQLMALALERVKCEFPKPYVVNITVSIMLSNAFAPFIDDVKPMLRESNMGVVYVLESYNGQAMSFEQVHDLIIGYARQFLNNNKTLTS